jgi:hypothetical protein
MSFVSLLKGGQPPRPTLDYRPSQRAAHALPLRARSGHGIVAGEGSRPWGTDARAQGPTVEDSGAMPAVLIGDWLRCPLGHNTTAAALAAAQAFYESTNWRVSLKAETV